MPSSSRHLARRTVVQALYQWELTGQAGAAIESSFIDNPSLSGVHRDYFRKLVEYIPQHVAEIDDLLRPFHKRAPERVDLIENAILRLGAYELVYERDIPVSVIIDEAIDLAKTYSSANSYRYINGVLDRVAGKARAYNGDNPTAA